MVNDVGKIHPTDCRICWLGSTTRDTVCQGLVITIASIVQSFIFLGFGRTFSRLRSRQHGAAPLSSHPWFERARGRASDIAQVPRRLWLRSLPSLCASAATATMAQHGFLCVRPHRGAQVVQPGGRDPRLCLVQSRLGGLHRLAALVACLVVVGASGR